MNKYLKIGDISIDFSYQYCDYFKDIIDEYKVGFLNKKHFVLSVEVASDLVEEKKEKKFVYKNRVKWYDDSETSIVTRFPNGGIKHIINYKNDFSVIKIILNESLKSRLAEYEYVLSGMMFFEIALRNRYLPIHASAIKFNDKGFLLSGPSKSGKSTQTELFLGVAGDAYVINEDKPLLKYENDKMFILGSPWSGKNVINKNEVVGLSGVFFLNKADSTEIKLIDKKSTIKHLMKNIHRPGDEANLSNMFEVLNHLVELNCFYQFDCEKNVNSAKVLKSFLEGNS